VYEYVGNLHVHTTYSDGAQPHSVVAASAIRAGLDFVIITDHNIQPRGIEGTYQAANGDRVLLLTGEEVHDMVRDPQRNHLLVYGADRELAPAAQGQPPQALLDAVQAADGIAFLAHPIDHAVPWAGEGSYSWVDWDIDGYTGLELWNYMSTFKTLLPDPLVGIGNLLAPDRAVTGPDADILQLWDRLLAEGRRVPVIGSADAHGTPMGYGPVRKIIYPYEFLFRCVNTHVLLLDPLSGSWEADGAAIYRALAEGRTFVGYGLPGDPRGFRFWAEQNGQTTASMGDEIALDRCASLHVAVPEAARLRLIRQGTVVAEQSGLSLTFQPEEPGAYRVEAWKPYKGRERGWVFSNPIYVRANG
jgi:hypothetical protein